MFTIEAIIITMFLLILIPSVTCIIFGIKISKLESRIYEQSSYILANHKRMNELYDGCKELSHQSITNSENLASLSQGVQYLFNEQKKISEAKIYPTPQLSEMIGVTIKEQIATEEVLSHNMRIPNSTSTMKIINVLSKTYPHVDTEYLTKRCLAQIEAHVNDTISEMQQQQNQNN